MYVMLPLHKNCPSTSVLAFRGYGPMRPLEIVSVPSVAALELTLGEACATASTPVPGRVRFVVTYREIVCNGRIGMRNCAGNSRVPDRLISTPSPGVTSVHPLRDASWPACRVENAKKSRITHNIRNSVV